MRTNSKSYANKYCLIIPGRGYAHTAEHAKQYKEKIKRIAQQTIREPFGGEVDIRLEYLYRNRLDRLDGDNLLKTICDALEGVAYTNDSQIVHHEVSAININSSFTIRGVPLDQQIGDLFANKESFTIIRLRIVSKRKSAQTTPI
jgi:Holliday junction resolvase RusA-like endonuclease